MYIWGDILVYTPKKKKITHKKERRGETNKGNLLTFDRIYRANITIDLCKKRDKLKNRRKGEGRQQKDQRPKV